MWLGAAVCLGVVLLLFFFCFCFVASCCCSLCCLCCALQGALWFGAAVLLVVVCCCFACCVAAVFWELFCCFFCWCGCFSFFAVLFAAGVAVGCCCFSPALPPSVLFLFWLLFLSFLWGFGSPGVPFPPLWFSLLVFWPLINSVVFKKKSNVAYLFIILHCKIFSCLKFFYSSFGDFCILLQVINFEISI